MRFDTRVTLPPWSHNRVHIGNCYQAPITSTVYAPDSDTLQLNYHDLSLRCPPPAQILHNRLSQRTVVDSIPHNLDAATTWADGLEQSLLESTGFQPVEVLHPGDIVVEVCYQREYTSHEVVPHYIRAARCGLAARDESPESTGHIPEHPRVPTSLREARRVAQPVRFASDLSWCACCFRRLLVIRHADRDELPDRREASASAEQLATRLRALGGDVECLRLPSARAVPSGWRERPPGW